MKAVISVQVPPTNGWMLELGYKDGGSGDNFQCGYRYSMLPSLCSLFEATTNIMYSGSTSPVIVSIVEITMSWSVGS